MTQNHWSKGGVTAHVHEDGSLELVGAYGNGLGRELARELFEFLDVWYGNSVPAKTEEATVVVGAADLKPAALQELKDSLARVSSPSEPEKAPEILPGDPETSTVTVSNPPKRRPGRPRKQPQGGEGGTA